ncbi:hypothetical protein [Limnoglobus roseus]|uniref:Uncharacterized protein n=1 Tax=Limnoglobus roseus TaxID=2598579 RepID=A0A5C1A970_9BACT|nr:hypothetical protein [Limnoglobus roseus]QEL14777.1 hypothetical protein PX52LOC_01671 [Limnoglobus roseus]
MSNKKHSPKPAEDKPDAEAGTAQDDAVAEVVAAEEAAEDEAQADPLAESAVLDQTEEPSPGASEVPAVIETIAQEPICMAAQDGLASRLSKVVTAIQTSGKPDTVHALHKVELIAGSLKISLPTAIDACDEIADERLKADLQNLLSIL